VKEDNDISEAIAIEIARAAAMRTFMLQLLLSPPPIVSTTTEEP